MKKTRLSVGFTDRQLTRIREYSEQNQCTLSEAVGRLFDGWMNNESGTAVTTLVLPKPEPDVPDPGWNPEPKPLLKSHMTYVKLMELFETQDFNKLKDVRDAWYSDIYEGQAKLDCDKFFAVYEEQIPD